jgi:hypothetical protein
MKYFDRHKHMSGETRRKILETITNFYTLEGVGMMGVQNMLYGLFDGFDYSQKIQEHKEMEIIKDQNLEMYNDILSICEEIDTYPKHTHDVTEH